MNDQDTCTVAADLAAQNVVVDKNGQWHVKAGFDMLYSFHTPR